VALFQRSGRRLDEHAWDALVDAACLHTHILFVLEVVGEKRDAADACFLDGDYTNMLENLEKHRPPGGLSYEELRAGPVGVGLLGPVEQGSTASMLVQDLTLCLENAEVEAWPALIM
jgi:hypothetical protein